MTLQVFIKYKYLQCTVLHLHIYTGGTLKGRPLHTKRIDLIGQLARSSCACSIFTVYICLSSPKLTIITSLILMKSNPTLPMIATDKYSNLHLCMLKLYFHTWWHSGHISMALQLNSGHIIITTWTKHIQWVCHSPILVILTICSFRVGSMPPIYIQISLIRQGHIFTIMLISFQGWVTHPEYPMQLHCG